MNNIKVGNYRSMRRGVGNLINIFINRWKKKLLMKNQKKLLRVARQGKGSPKSYFQQCSMKGGVRLRPPRVENGNSYKNEDPALHCTSISCQYLLKRMLHYYVPETDEVSIEGKDEMMCIANVT